MAIPDFSVSSPGQANNAGDERALYLTLFGQEILGAFTRETKFMNRFRLQNLTGGTAFQFPAIGKHSASYHAAGTTLAGSDINHSKRTITVDNKLVSHTFVDELEEILNFHEIRGEYANQMGSALAVAADQRLLQVACLAARAAATVTGGDGGSQVVAATAKTVGSVLAAAIFSAAQKLDEKNTPSDGRFCALLPAQYYLLAQTTSLINKDWNGAGDYSKGSILRIADIELVKTNSLPSTLVVADGGEKNVYSGNFANTAAVVSHSSAVGTVTAKGMSFQSKWMLENLGTLLVAWYALGHGILRPEASVEIVTA